MTASTDRFRRVRPVGLPFGGAYGGNVISAGGYLLALWQHEATRVFCDKMVSAEDKAWVGSAITDLARCVRQGLGSYICGLAVLGKMRGLENGIYKLAVQQLPLLDTRVNCLL